MERIPIFVTKCGKVNQAHASSMERGGGGVKDAIITWEHMQLWDKGQNYIDPYLKNKSGF